MVEEVQGQRGTKGEGMSKCERCGTELTAKTSFYVAVSGESETSVTHRLDDCFTVLMKQRDEARARVKIAVEGIKKAYLLENLERWLGR